jgi:Rrf2 family protein
MAANSQFSMALHVLAFLAMTGDENVKSECIAESVNTNAVVIRRLLGQLRDAGLVRSQTGAAGGTRLAMPADELRLGDVYKAVCDGKVFALHTRAPNPDCPIGRNIEAVLSELQSTIDKAVVERLGEYSLADILTMVEHNRFKDAWSV